MNGMLYKKVLSLLLVVLVSSCGGGGGSSNSSEPPTNGGGTPPEIINFGVTLSSDVNQIESDQLPNLVTVSLVSEQQISSMSSSDVSITNGSVESIQLLSQTNFILNIAPDGLGDISVSVPANVLTSGSSTNNESNTVSITLVDNIGPDIALDYTIVSFTPEGSPLLVEVSATVNQSVLTESNVTVVNGDITGFSSVSDGVYQVTLIASQAAGELTVVISEDTIFDSSGNGNQASNLIEIGLSPQAPQETVQLDVQPQAVGLNLSWNTVENASFYQIYDVSNNDQATLIADQITGDIQASYILDGLLTRIGQEIQVYACNSVGCSNSEVYPLTDLLSSAVGYFKSPEATGGQYFGNAISFAGDGNTLAVSARGDALVSQDHLSGQDELLSSSGSVYIYRKLDDEWAFETVVLPPSRDQFDQFGYSVSLNYDGTILAVGARFEDGEIDDSTSNLMENSGAVYVFNYSGDSWSFDQYLKASNTSSVFGFGYDVILDSAGDTLLVTGGGWVSSTQISSVYTYIFEKTGTDDWIESERIFIRSFISFSDFIVADLADDGNAFILGLPDTSNDSQGAVRIYKRDEQDWSSVATPSAVSDQGNFGSSVAINQDGSVIAIGDDRVDYANQNVDSGGAAYVYDFNTTDQTYDLQQTFVANNRVDFLDFGERVELNAEGDRLFVASNDYSLVQIGVHLSASPNDNRPFSNPAIYVYEKDDTQWSFSSFLKGYTSMNDISVDSSGNIVAIGSSSDRRLVDGVLYYEETADLNADLDFNTGSVLVF